MRGVLYSGEYSQQQHTSFRWLELQQHSINKLVTGSNPTILPHFLDRPGWTSWFMAIPTAFSMNWGCACTFSPLFVPIYNSFVASQCHGKVLPSKSKLQYFSTHVSLGYLSAILERGFNDPTKQYPSKNPLISWNHDSDSSFAIDTFEKFFMLFPPVHFMNIMSNSPISPPTSLIIFGRIQNSFRSLRMPWAHWMGHISTRGPQLRIGMHHEIERAVSHRTV